MESRKRKLPENLLGRRVRARAEPEPDLDEFENETDNSDAPSEDGVAQHDSGEEDDEEDEGSSDDEDQDEEEEQEQEQEEEYISVDAAKISFGALAKAQATLPPSSRRKKKAAAAAAAASSEEDNDAPDEQDQGFRSQFLSSKKEKPPSRSSKHAPMEMSSKRPVSRKREVIPVRKLQARDPRFDPLVAARSSAGASSGKHDVDAAEDRARRAYSFLDEYRDDEMRQLKAAIKKTRNSADKEKLQRALMSMESRKRAREQKDRERAVVEEHRRREKELVKEGKKANPFYLKKSEQRKRLLVDQFTGMSEKQREKAIEKKRKKIAGKEKKELPMQRRMRE